MKKVAQKLKNNFIPHEGNDHRPLFLKSNFLLWVVVGLFVLKLFLISFTFYFPSSLFFAAVNRATLISLTNQQRAAAGLNTLVENSKLNQAAAMKANDMLANGYFAHTSPAGLGLAYWISQVGYPYRYAGENLAMDFLDSSEVFNAWMSSSSHRANILNPNYQDIGMAVVSGNFNGNQTTIVVQMFGSTGITTTSNTTSSVPVSTKTTTSQTFPKTTKKTTTPKATTDVSTGPSLLSYYAERGQSLPSLEERAILFEKFGLGPRDSYNGAAEQNAALLEKLLESEKAQQTEPSSAPISTPNPSQTPTLTKEQIQIIEEAKKGEQRPIFAAGKIRGATIENTSLKFKILDFLANYSHIISQAMFLAVLLIVVVSLALDIFIKRKIQHRDLILRGLLYTFILLVLFLLDKAVILKLFPHSLTIF